MRPHRRRRRTSGRTAAPMASPPDAAGGGRGPTSGEAGARAPRRYGGFQLRSPGHCHSTGTTATPACLYDPPMPLVRGATAAGLQIVRLLGSGQIGELYLAEHPRLPRHLALKVVSDDLSADPEYRHRFKRESELAAALWHPHIGGIYDRGEFEGRLWLSMDYVDGVDAAHLLSDTYPNGMPPDLVVEI